MLLGLSKSVVLLGFHGHRGLQTVMVLAIDRWLLQHRLRVRLVVLSLLSLLLLLLLLLCFTSRAFHRVGVLVVAILRVMAGME
jgi:hypothetical protein